LYIFLVPWLALCTGEAFDTYLGTGMVVLAIYKYVGNHRKTRWRLLWH